MNAAPSRLTLTAPAKVNLFLHVTGRRADGYHLLESLFAPIDLADTVSVAIRSDGVIRRVRSVPGIPEDDDLALRAARALQRDAAVSVGADIDVEKRIPMGAGLGGGSSDAAAVLLGLNAVWNLRRPRDDLARIGVRLGADIPFFLGPGPAIARGIGEDLTPVSLPRVWLALATPEVHVPTPAIFAAPELTRDTPSAKMDVFSEGYGRNDLEAVACARHPEIGAALAELRRRSPHARMTGSGSSVFASFASGELAHGAVLARPPGTRGFVARSLGRHPLAAFA